MLSVEISTIYKRDDRTRKVHHLIYLPDLDAVDRFNARLGRIGNLGSDGRPILGLDSRDLLEIVLEASADGYLVPAHIWTPWFSALGSKSGFDRIADCYADLAEHIFAVETGLSSDPAMNWRVTQPRPLPPGVQLRRALAAGARPRGDDPDRPRLDYFAVRDALRTGDGLVGTLEFFPEEGKYHADGHRACGVSWTPGRDRASTAACASSCGKPVTVGVQSRVDELADRPDGRAAARGHRRASSTSSSWPRSSARSTASGRGASRSVERSTSSSRRSARSCPFSASVPLDDVTRVGGELLGEAIRRLRAGDVRRTPGFDGEYGVIRLFDAGRDRRGHLGRAVRPAGASRSGRRTPRRRRRGHAAGATVPRTTSRGRRHGARGQRSRRSRRRLRRTSRSSRCSPAWRTSAPACSTGSTRCSGWPRRRRADRC